MTCMSDFSEIDAEAFCADLMLCRYPPKMIPGCHVMIHTSANTDRDARLLLGQIGIPFYGKRVD